MAALRPVYSIQVFSLAPALTDQSYTVPDGARIILRDMDARDESATAGDQIAVYNAAGGILWTAKYHAADDPWHYQWTGRQVYNPGEIIRVHVFAGAWSIQGSGYELTLT